MKMEKNDRKKSFFPFDSLIFTFSCPNSLKYPEIIPFALVLVLFLDELLKYFVGLTWLSVWAYGKGHTGHTRTPLAVGLRMVSD